MKEIEIIHNPRCSKSRQALEILNKKKVKINISLYLSEKMSKKKIKEILKKLKIKPIELIRKKEKEFKSLRIFDNTHSDERLIEFMLDYPILIERPIVINGNKAIIARPPEKLLEIL